MNQNEQFYSFKKNPKNEIIVGTLGISSTILIGIILYTILDKFVFDKFADKSLFGSGGEIFSNTKMIFTIVLIFILFLLVIVLIICSYKAILLIFQRERVVLAKITRVSLEKSGSDEDFVDYPNASLSKSLAKNFKQVIVHQKAVEGKIVKICIYASQTGIFFYPSASNIFHRLSGVYSLLGIELVNFTEEDYHDYLKDLTIEHDNSERIIMKGLGLKGEPAFQHISKYTTPVDGLVKTIVDKSKKVEIHTFSTIRQGMGFQFWLRKRFLPKTKDRHGKEVTLSPEQKHRLTETDDMEKSGYVNGEVSVVVKGEDNFDVDIIQNQIQGSIDSIFDGFTRKIIVSEINPRKILSAIKQHQMVINKNTLISGYSARAIIDVYRKPLSGIPFIKDIMNPPSTKRPEETHSIFLGETITGEEIRTSLQDHVHHCGIFGTTGFGKSDWIRSEIEQILEHYPLKRIMIFDFDGEYAQAFINHPNFLVLEANNEEAPLLINPFQDDFTDNVEHADSLFKYFNEVLTLDQRYSEFTPPQKTMLWEGIITTTEQEESDEKNYLAFERNLRKYAEENQNQFVRGDLSIISLLNKMRFYKRELRNIIMCKQSNFSMDMLERTNIIFNLRSIRNETGKRAITTLILYQLRNYMIEKGSCDLWLKIYLEEATIVTPRNPVIGQMYFVEELLNVIRKFGASITLIGTTSDEITKFILESKYLVNIGCISEQLCKKMNTDLKTQHSLKKFQLDIKLPDEEYPIRLVKLSRPARTKLSEFDYEQFIRQSSKYEEIRSNSHLIDESDFEVIIDGYNLIETCFSACSFNFLERKQCLLWRKNKLNQILKEALGEFVRIDCNGWNGVRELFNINLKEALDKLSIIITTSLSDDTKLGRRTITAEDKTNLIRCAFTWVLQGLSKELVLPKAEVESFYTDYEIELEKLNVSSYGFDNDQEVYAFNTGDYCYEW